MPPSTPVSVPNGPLTVVSPFITAAVQSFRYSPGIPRTDLQLHGPDQEDKNPGS